MGVGVEEIGGGVKGRVYGGVEGGVDERNNLSLQLPRSEKAIASSAQGSTTTMSGA